MASPTTTDAPTSSPASLKAFKIVIVGGGIAGLALAHMLEGAKSGKRGSNLLITVYEQRAEDTSFVKYPLQLSKDARTALKSMLSVQEYNNLVAASDYGITHGGVSIHTPQLTRLYSDKATGDDQPNRNHALPQFTHRWVLKDILKQGVNLVRGKRVVRTRHEAASEGTEVHAGKIRVVLDDGSHELADLVVGADGVGSVIRAQLSPSSDAARFPLLPYVVLQFKLAAPFESLAHILPDMNGINQFVGTKSTSLTLVPLHSAEGYSPLPAMTPRAALIQSEQGPFAEADASVLAVKNALEDPKTGYIFAKAIIPSPSGWEDLTEGAWIDKILDSLRFEGYANEIVTAVEDDLIPGTLGAWGIVSSGIGKSAPWTEHAGGRTVLIGDAMHAIPPIGGHGCAAALRDAAELADTILYSSEAGGRGTKIESLLPSFQKGMIIRSETYLKEVTQQLNAITASGINAYLKRGVWGAMDLYAPIAGWMSGLTR
ncbi:hypothetical protein I317_01645 [Kwoniella heveanensis CBS 569]|nr:hypothetical protein I317_01645 [Kwoniella heveanensis CBS 569]